MKVRGDAESVDTAVYRSGNNSANSGGCFFYLFLFGGEHDSKFKFPIFPLIEQLRVKNAANLLIYSICLKEFMKMEEQSHEIIIIS